MTPSPYPIQLSLRGRTALVAGAGRVASRKLERLLACGAVVRVVAPEVSEAVAAMAQANTLSVQARAFEERDVEGAFLVIAATDNTQVNARIAQAARRAGALVLRVDAPGDSDFTLPSCSTTEHVAATISTGGRAPAASRRLARELAQWLTQGPDRFAAEMARARLLCSTREDAATHLRALAEGPLFEACRAEDEARISQLVTMAVEAP